MASFSLKDADKFLYEKSREMREAAFRGLTSAGQRTVQHIQTVVIPKTLVDGASRPPVDEGAYRAGWRSRPVGDLAVLVYHANPKIAAIVEYGVRAKNVKIGRLMINALAKWAARKGLGGQLTQNVKGELSVRAASNEFQSIAWAIAQKFKKDGMPGRRVLERAGDSFIREEVQREITREMKRKGSSK